MLYVPDLLTKRPDRRKRHIRSPVSWSTDFKISGFCFPGYVHVNVFNLI